MNLGINTKKVTTSDKQVVTGTVNLAPADLLEVKKNINARFGC